MRLQRPDKILHLRVLPEDHIEMGLQLRHRLRVLQKGNQLVLEVIQHGVFDVKKPFSNTSFKLGNRDRPVSQIRVLVLVTVLEVRIKLFLCYMPVFGV